MCDDFRTSRANEKILCSLNWTHALSEERWYGRRLSIKHVNSDTLGVPLRESIDKLSSLRFRLLDLLAMESLINADALSV